LFYFTGNIQLCPPRKRINTLCSGKERKAITLPFGIGGLLVKTVLCKLLCNNSEKCSSLFPKKATGSKNVK
jgi:hypothetical protein